MLGELRADIGEHRVLAALRGRGQRAVEGVGAGVERGPVWVLSPMQVPDLDRSYRSG